MAAPLSQCKKIVMVSNGKGDVGANKITAEILDIVANLPKSVEALTGIDISKVNKTSTDCNVTLFYMTFSPFNDIQTVNYIS